MPCGWNCYRGWYFRLHIYCKERLVKHSFSTGNNEYLAISICYIKPRHQGFCQKSNVLFRESTWRGKALIIMNDRLLKNHVQMGCDDSGMHKTLASIYITVLKRRPGQPMYMRRLSHIKCDTWHEFYTAKIIYDINSTRQMQSWHMPWISYSKCDIWHASYTAKAWILHNKDNHADSEMLKVIALMATKPPLKMKPTVGQSSLVSKQHSPLNKHGMPDAHYWH